MISYVLHEDFKKQDRISDEDEGLECEDAPTVVIDESLEDNPMGQQFRKHPTNEDEASHEYGNNSSGGIRMVKASASQHQFLDNIQAALQSIRNQEAQENEQPDSKSKKKGVTIMSIEEEEALISQINEIRERIRRGETVAQKSQQVQ